MKTLFIVRHGKSSWDDPGLSDQDRPLKNRGIRDATLMAEKLKAAGLIPDRILSSPANRALHTAEIFAAILGHAPENLQVSNTLYFSGAEAIIRLVQQIPDSTERLMIVGHNPDFTEIVNSFSSTSLYNLPTAGVVVFEFNTDSWKEISRSRMVNDLYEFPGKSGNEEHKS
jgi:phosphohistidine phosphatase